MANNSNLSFTVAALDRASATFVKLGKAAQRLERQLNINSEISIKTKKAEESVGHFARKIHTDVSKAIHSLPDLKIDANSSDVDRTIAKIRGELKSLTDKRVGVGVTTGETLKKVAELRSELTALSAKTVDVRVQADVTKALADLKAVNFEASKAEREVGAFAKKMHADITTAINTLPDIEINADSSDAHRAISDIRRELQTITDRKVGVGISTEEASRRVDALRRKLNELANRAPNLRVRADAAKALADLKTVGVEAARLNGKRSDIQIVVNAQRTLSIINWVVQGLGAITMAAAPAAAALQTALNLGSAVAQGAGAAAIGFSGVGDAVKDLDKVQKSAGKTASAGANTAEKAANNQKRDIRAIEDAQVSLTRARVDYNRAVGAKKDAIVSAQRAERDATRDVTDAQQEQRDAVKDLVRAREDYREQISDTNRELRGSRLDEEEAVWAVKDALDDLNEARQSGTKGRDLREFEIAYERAKLNVEETKDRIGDLGREQTRATDSVTSAQRGAREATRAVGDAERNVSEVRRDNLRSLAQAQERISDAQGAITDAQRNLVQAQNPIRESLAQTGSTGAAAAGATREAFDKLGPAGKKFATFLHDDLYPSLRKIRDGVQATMLPKMTTALKNMQNIAPLVTDKLADTGNVIGDLSIKASNMMNSKAFKSDFGDIMDANNRSLSRFGNSGLSLFDVFRNVSAAAIPLQDRFSKAAEKSAAMFQTWIQGKRDSGELTTFFKNAGNTLADFWRETKQVVKGLWDFGQAAAPVTHVVLELAAGVIKGFTALSTFSKPLATIAASGLAGAVILSKLGVAVASIGKVSGAAKTGLASLAGLAMNIIPTRAYSNLEGFRSKVDNVAISAGAMTEKMTKSSAAGGRVTSAISGVGKAASGAVSALPVLGIAVAAFATAWDQTTTSADEAKQAFAQGGQAAIDAAKELQTQTNTMSTSWAQYRSSVKGVEGAQADAARAAWIHQEAVRRWGEKSPQATLAASDLATANDKVANEQWAAAHGTDAHTAAINRQRNAELESKNSSLAYHDALAAVDESIRRNGTAWSLNTQKGRENRRTVYSLIAAGNTDIEKMRERGATQGQLNKKHDEQRNALWKLGKRLGLTDGQINDLVGTMNTVPPAKTTHINAPGVVDNRKKANKYREDLDKIPDDVTTTFTQKLESYEKRGEKWAPVWGQGLTPTKLGTISRASGGIVLGEGTGTSDSILARLSNGEFVINAKATASWLPLLERINSGQLKPPAYATGGKAGSKPAAKKPAAAKPSAPTSGGSASATASVSVDTSGLASLTKDSQALVTTGLAPLSAAIQKTTVPDLAKVGTQAAGPTSTGLRKLTTALPVLGKQNTATSTNLRHNWQMNTAKVVQSTTTMNNRQRQMQAVSTGSWRTINSVVGNNINAIRNRHFAGMQQGMANTRAAMAHTANAARTEFNRMRAAAADPIRAMIFGPFNNGLIKSWNRLASDFNLKPKVGKITPGFAVGGYTGDGAMLEPKGVVHGGEFVIKKTITKRARPFLEALNEGSPEALQATGARGYAKGGIVADTGSQANAALLRGAKFAKAQSGKPYIWGGVGPRGYDCSGYMSAITNVLRGLNPHQRVGVARSEPWPGFKRGLKGAFSLGGSRVHTAGTLSGVNVESGGSHGNVAYGGPAVGADHGQFPTKSYLPFVGGRFVPGGMGGGGLDVTSIISDAFGKVDGSSLTKRWPGNRAAATAKAEVGMAAKAVRGYATKRLESVAGTVGGSAGSPEVMAAVKAVASQYGWGSGPQWEALKWIISKESSWDPNAANGASSARGLFQKMTSVHGPIEKTVGGQAKWGIGTYIKGRYHTPLGAKAFWQSHGWYDKGGVARGKGFMPKNTIKPERVLSPQTTRDFGALVDAMVNHRGVFVRGGESYGGQRSAPVIENMTINPPPGSTNADVVKQYGWETRRIQKSARR